MARGLAGPTPRSSSGKVFLGKTYDISNDQHHWPLVDRRQPAPSAQRE